MRFGRLSVDYIPTLCLAGALPLSLLFAHVYAAHQTLQANDPFLPVWDEYSFRDACVLVLVVCSGLLASVLASRRRHSESESVVPDLAGIAGGGQWLAVSLICLVVVAAAKGQYLWRADSYLEFAWSGTARSVANLMGILGLLAAGACFRRFRLPGGCLLVLHFCVQFAMGSRVLALAPIAFLVGLFLVGGRPRAYCWVAGAVAAFLLLPVALSLRLLDSHGMIPYLRWACRNPGALWSGDNVVSVLGNVGFSIPIAQWTQKHLNVTASERFASILPPVPPFSSRWDTMQDLFRAHWYIPTSALGEWANCSYVALFVAVFVWSQFTIWTIRGAGNRPPTLRGKAYKLAYLAIIGLNLLSAVYALQYNTRAVATIMYIVAGLWIVCAIGKVSFARSSFDYTSNL